MGKDKHVQSKKHPKRDYPIPENTVFFDLLLFLMIPPDIFSFMI